MRRVSCLENAELYLKDARRDAEQQCLHISNAVYVARVRLQIRSESTGLVYHDGNETTVDFTDGDLSPRQMRELGVL